MRDKAKLAAIGLVGAGAVLLLSAVLNKIDNENCIAENRAFSDGFYDTARVMQAGTFSCFPDHSGILFVTGSAVKAAGIVVLVLGLKSISLISLSRQ